MASAALSTMTTVSAGVEIERQWRAHQVSACRLRSQSGDVSMSSTNAWSTTTTTPRRWSCIEAGTTACAQIRDLHVFDVEAPHQLDGGIAPSYRDRGPLRARPRSVAGIRRGAPADAAAVRPIGHIITAPATRIYTYEGRRVEVVRDRVRYPIGRDEWRLEVEGAAEDVTRVADVLEQLRLGLAPVRRGKIQTLLRRCAA